MKKYNVVFITIDSLRADFVGFLNSKEKNTPFLDKLAKTSFVYTNAIASGVPTFFSFPSIMTGTLPFAYGYTLGIANLREAKTIAEVLHDNGYITLAILADNPQLYTLYNFDRGFTVYDDGQERKSEQVLASINTMWSFRERIPAAVLSILEYVRAGVTVFKGFPSVHIDGMELNKKAEIALSAAPNRPFFLWLHYQDAHYPYTAGMKTLRGFLKKIVLSKQLADAGRTMKIKTAYLEPIKDAYRKSIRYVDSVIEDIYERIMTQYPNTIFIITSDHGEAFMEHGMYYHEPYSLYNELINVPLLIQMPSRKRGTIARVVSLVSIARTICSLVGVKHHVFNGTDLTSDKRDLPVNHISRILYKCRAPSIHFQIFDNTTEIKGFNELLSYTTNTYKYIIERGGTVEEFYNREKDPGETKNIVHTMPKSLRRSLKKKLEHLS